MDDIGDLKNGGVAGRFHGVRLSRLAYQCIYITAHFMRTSELWR
jgi:hypothetical protein